MRKAREWAGHNRKLGSSSWKTKNQKHAMVMRRCRPDERCSGWKQMKTVGRNGPRHERLTLLFYGNRARMSSKNGFYYARDTVFQTQFIPMSQESQAGNRESSDIFLHFCAGTRAMWNGERENVANPAGFSRAILPMPILAANMSLSRIWKDTEILSSRT